MGSTMKAPLLSCQLCSDGGTSFHNIHESSSEEDDRVDHANDPFTSVGSHKTKLFREGQIGTIRTGLVLQLSLIHI